MKKRLQALALLLVSFPMGTAIADEKPINLDDIAGAYRFPLTIRTVDDGLVSQEDILEIVKESATRAYVRTRLHFDNGHVCVFWGIAEAKGSQLISHASAESEAAPRSCTLVLKVESKDIVFDDLDHQCQPIWCGARGHFSGVKLKRSKRRSITYLKRIKESEQYRQAVREYEHLIQSRPASSDPSKRP